MLLAQDFRRQSYIFARSADDCDDRRLAERLRGHGFRLAGQGRRFEEATKLVRHRTTNRLLTKASSRVFL
jgi:hypothetical protein